MTDISEDFTQDVQIYAPRRRRDTQKNPIQVRWRVAGRETSKGFPTKTAANTFYGRLNSAYRAGELFRKSTMRPTSWDSESQNKSVPTVLEAAQKLCEELRDKNLAGNTHKRVATALTNVLLGLYPQKELHDRKAASVVLRGRALAAKPTTAATKYGDEVLHQLQKAAPPVTILTDPRAVRHCLDSLTRLRSGEFAVQRTFSRQRDELTKLINLAIREEWIDENILINPRLGWSSPKLTSGGLADPREAMSAKQVRAVIEVIRNNPKTRKYALIYSLMYWCALRTGEARALQYGDIDSRGWLRVGRQAVAVGAAWSITQDHDDIKGLKARKVSEERIAPLPTSALADYRKHADEFPGAPDDFLIPIPLGGNLCSAANLAKIWKRAREKVLKAEIEQNPALGHRLYSLRVSGISRLIAKGVPVPTIAEWVGNSPKVLHQYYSKFIEDDQRRWIDLADE